MDSLSKFQNKKDEIMRSMGFDRIREKAAQLSLEMDEWDFLDDEDLTSEGDYKWSDETRDYEDDGDPLFPLPRKKIKRRRTNNEQGSKYRWSDIQRDRDDWCRSGK